MLFKKRRRWRKLENTALCIECFLVVVPVVMNHVKNKKSLREIFKGNVKKLHYKAESLVYYNKKCVLLNVIKKY